MTVTIERTAASTRRPAAIGTLRLRLKPAHQKCGYVQGAWWPRSTVLSAELPPLLTALSSRLGTLDWVRYHAGAWSEAPAHAAYPGGEVVRDHRQRSPNLISVSGPDFGELTLLVVPPYTDPGHAHRVVMTAASVNDSSTPDELLGASVPCPSDNRAALTALQRWESDGGAAHPA